MHRIAVVLCGNDSQNESMLRPLRPVLLPSAVIAALVLAGCGDSTSSDEATSATDVAAAAAVNDSALAVVAAFYPLEFLTTRVGGDRIDVTGLTPPGAEAHDLELSPQALAGLTESDLVVVLSGFQPAVDDALSGADVPVVDLTEVADRPYEEGAEHTDEEAHEEEEAHEDEEAHAEEEAHGDTDPHFWTDPTHMADAARMIADALSEADPEGADVFETNTEALVAELDEIDELARDSLDSCEIDTLVTAHDAFGYFADRYGFEVNSINGLSPDQEPDAGTLAEISDFVADNGIETVYTETLVSSAIADTVAAEAGARTSVLDPIEGLTETSAGEDYLEVMRANIDAVRTGQACT